MAQSAKRFAALLQEGITAVANRTAKPKGVIRDELGYAIGRKGGSALEYWCYGDGRIPKQQAEVAALARALVEGGKLDQRWLTAFLASASYPNCDALIADLFPAAVDQRFDKLPLALTPFVGRRAELTELAALLANPDCRLITLTGPGGSGKTRLAIEAARHAQATFPAGAVFVALAPLTAAELVAPTIATALNLTLGGHADPETQLLQYLRRQKYLLLLDNFEQLLPAHLQPLEEAAVNPGLTLISSILTQAPQVTLLVTSRERLNIQGEWVYGVGGLDMPAVPTEEKWTSTSAVLEEYSAPLLFVQTARRGQANFAPDPKDEAAIVHICRLMEGIPLALELAAAWVHVLSCQEIAREIEAGLNFLTTTQRNLPSRHRSMRAVFDHSWQLLNAAEKQVFVCCSVFRGGFTREAAEQVGSASLPVLAALVDKSLFSRNDKGHYTVHELVRQYGAERLAESHDLTTTHNAHLTFFMALAEEAEPYLESGPEIVEWYDRIEREHDNLRAALDWAIVGGAVEAGLRIVGALWSFWMIRGYADQGWRHAERFLAQPKAAAPTCTRARALHTAGVLAFYLSRMESAQFWLTEGIALSRSLGAEGKRVLAMNLTAYSYTLAGIDNFAAVQVISHEMLAIGEELEDAWVKAHAWNQLGLAAIYVGDLSTARRFFYSAFTNFQADGQSVMRGIALLHLGRTLTEEGDYANAEAYFRQSLAIFKEVGDKPRSTHALWQLSMLYLMQDRLSEAQELLNEAISLGRKVAMSRNLVRALDDLGRLACRQGDYTYAYDLYRESLTLNLEIGHPVHIADSLGRFACLAAAQGQCERAATLFSAAEACYTGVNTQASLISTMHDPGRRSEHEQLLAQVRTVLGEDAFTSTWTAGAAMTLDQAVAYALETTPALIVPNGP